MATKYSVEKRDGKWSIIDPATQEVLWTASQSYPPNSPMDLSLLRLSVSIAARFGDELWAGGGMA